MERDKILKGNGEKAMEIEGPQQHRQKKKIKKSKHTVHVSSFVRSSSSFVW
jgi:hypothetical protein